MARPVQQECGMKPAAPKDRSRPRITVEDADACVEHVARAYERMSYAELRDLAGAKRDGWSVTVRDVEWRGGLVRLTIQVSHYGLFLPRATVEIVASAEGDESWPWTPCVYLERRPNGRLRKSSTAGYTALAARRDRVLVGVVVYGFLAAMLAVLAWQCRTSN